MPLVLKRDDILRRGGKYLPQETPPEPPKPAVVAPAPVDPRVQKALEELARVLNLATKEQREQAMKLATLAEELKSPQTVGSFSITVTARDGDGRISAVDLQCKP